VLVLSVHLCPDWEGGPEDSGREEDPEACHQQDGEPRRQHMPRVKALIKQLLHDRGSPRSMLLRLITAGVFFDMPR